MSSYSQNRRISFRQNPYLSNRRRNQLVNRISNQHNGILPIVTYPFPTPQTTTNTRRRQRRNTNYTNRRSTTNIVRAPAAIGMEVESANNSPSTTFRGTNYVFDIPTSTSFSSYSWFMHPVNIPFLKEQSELFSRYQFIDLKYRIVTTAPTNISGQHWSGYQMRSREFKPADVGEAQYLQAFHLAPIWKSDTHFTSVDRAILTDRWYSTAMFGAAIDPQLTAGWLYFGTASMSENQPLVHAGMLEIAYTIQFRDRRLPKGTSLNEHNLASLATIAKLRDLHKGTGDHNKAVTIRLQGLAAEEQDSNNDEIHRSAVLEIINDVKRHCKAQNSIHAGLSSLLTDEFEELHPPDDLVVVESESAGSV